MEQKVRSKMSLREPEDGFIIMRMGRPEKGMLDGRRGEMEDGESDMKTC